MSFIKVLEPELSALAILSQLLLIGELQSVDGYMNIALEKTEEYVNGKLQRSYGDAFVRGNNGIEAWSIFDVRCS